MDKDDPQKDGCYHCLYAYRQSQQIGNISRTTAIRILKSILSGKDNVQKIDKINDIPVNPLFDSELEQRFMEAIRTKVGAANVSDTIRNGKHSYYVKIENFAWEIEPQVPLDAGSGVSVDCKPDFVFWPVSAPEHKPVAVANIDLPYETTFYEEEWNRIVIAQEALTLEKYVKATRNGRGTRLDRKKRMQVWKVFENYQNLMKENQIRDINTAMYESTKLLQSAGRKPRYASIIIDEGQDFSDNAYRLIRALAGEEHPNDIFIVGDSHQRIYRNYPTLSKCGINVRGRSSILKINYRTTEEIRKHAFALLNGISFDDLDEDLDLGDKCQSLTHGEKPIVENFENANDEFDFLLREVKKLKENGVSLTDICVVARTKKLVDDYIALFTRAGIRSYAIKRNKVDDRSFDGLRVATMHRVKGLEFKYVFIAAVNNRIIPLPFS